MSDIGIELDKLPQWAQKQIADKLIAAQNGTGSHGAPQETRTGGRKYRNTPTTVQGADGSPVRLDSKKESERFQTLLVLLRAGAISDLRLQRDFTLQEAYTTPDGNRVRAIRYRADFTYIKDGKLVVEDVKGGNATKTREYSIKKKLVREKFGVEIVEV